MRVEDFISRLQGVKRSGSGYIAICPAHDDTHQSLSVSTGNNGGILIHCHAGCPTEDVVAAMGLKMTDLIASTSAKQDFGALSRDAEIGPLKTDKPSPIVATYIYTDIDGKPLAKKFRREDKSFFWQHIDGTKEMPKVPMVYNAPALKSDCIFIVEGEKDCETMKRLKLAAISPTNGAKSKIDPTFNECFRGKAVYIIPDNDKPGMDFAIKTADQLYGIAETLKIIDLKSAFTQLPERGDISDVVEAAGEEMAIEALTVLAKSAPDSYGGLNSCSPEGESEYAAMIRNVFIAEPVFDGRYHTYFPDSNPVEILRQMNKEESTMNYYHTCPDCGAHLDPAERCDCQKRSAPGAATPETQNEPKPTNSTNILSQGAANVKEAKL